MYLHFDNKGEFRGYSQRVPTWLFWPIWVYLIFWPILMIVGGLLLPFIIFYAWNNVILPYDPWLKNGPTAEYRAWLITMLIICSIPLWILTLTGYWWQ